MGLPESILTLGGVSYLCVKRYHPPRTLQRLQRQGPAQSLFSYSLLQIPRGRIQDGIKSRKMGTVSRKQLTTSIMLGGSPSPFPPSP